MPRRLAKGPIGRVASVITITRVDGADVIEIVEGSGATVRVVGGTAPRSGSAGTVKR